MTPGTQIRKRDFPRCNGRPQLWVSLNDHDEMLSRVRIIYPNGIVAYFSSEETQNGEWKWVEGPWVCTSMSSMERSQGACLRYSNFRDEYVYFGGYL